MVISAGGDGMNDARAMTSEMEAAREQADALPLSHRFVLGSEVTLVQRAFLEKNGFLIFSGFASPDEVAEILASVDQVQQRFFEEKRRKAYGVPIWVGRDHEGADYIQRFAFLSMYSDVVHKFVTDSRFDALKGLFDEDARVGHEERDGVVFNRYIRAAGSLRPGLGWHTDSLRQVFYGQLPGPMLNVGLHFERITAEDGGLRLIPGSHNQGYRGYLFEKLYFLDHRPDPREVAIETFPGDLTVHDGRLWHRVQASAHTGLRSRRHSMYVPFVTGPYHPKSEDSGTQAYMRLFSMVMRAKGRMLRMFDRS